MDEEEIKEVIDTSKQLLEAQNSDNELFKLQAETAHKMVSALEEHFTRGEAIQLACALLGKK